jgi:hypothetical protein
LMPARKTPDGARSEIISGDKGIPCWMGNAALVGWGYDEESAIRIAQALNLADRP